MWPLHIWTGISPRGEMRLVTGHFEIDLIGPIDTIAIWVIIFTDNVITGPAEGDVGGAGGWASRAREGAVRDPYSPEQM